VIQPEVFPRQPIAPSRVRLNGLAQIDTLLRDPDQFFGDIGQGSGLREKMRAMLLGSLACLALYGGLLGSTHSLGQSLSSAAKLPLLFLATLLICAPALYLFNILFGANQRLSQSVMLVLTAITVTAVLLFSFAPVTLFFILTAPDSYQFFKLLNVLFFAVAGSSGAGCLSRGLRVVSACSPGYPMKNGRFMFALWLALYSFVGSQMAWTLRPYVGYPGSPFELFRQLGGNFYTDILASIGEILGFIIVK
jgi:hypothetical protein